MRFEALKFFPKYLQGDLLWRQFAEVVDQVFSE